VRGDVHPLVVLTGVEGDVRDAASGLVLQHVWVSCWFGLSESIPVLAGVETRIGTGRLFVKSKINIVTIGVDYY
ncbi:MAG TPA: hypothetical protein VK971_05320, partial [Thiohalobacter sp.]|nr:hypothetical protein [Thiohalobacter sp.]